VKASAPALRPNPGIAVSRLKDVAGLDEALAGPGARRIYRMSVTSDSATLPLTERNFSEIVAATPRLLVDFWAPWCGPCRAIAPVLEELARAEAGRLVVAKVNVDQEPGLAQRFGVQAIPTLLLFKDGQVVDTMVGAPPKAELQRRLAALA
jgi:thioredoxin